MTLRKGASGVESRLQVSMQFCVLPVGAKTRPNSAWKLLFYVTWMATIVIATDSTAEAMDLPQWVELARRADDVTNRPFKSFRNLFGLDESSLPDEPYLGDGLCAVDNKTMPYELYNHQSCPPRFYCPNANESDPLSFPSMCPPTLECQKLRLSSKFCPAQGKYEPVVSHFE